MITPAKRIHTIGASVVVIRLHTLASLHPRHHARITGVDTIGAKSYTAAGTPKFRCRMCRGDSTWATLKNPGAARECSLNMCGVKLWLWPRQVLMTKTPTVDDDDEHYAVPLQAIPPR